MKIEEVKEILTISYKAQDAVLLRGLHGVGKTEIVKEWAQENDFHLEVLYLSNQDVSDLIGIATIKEVFNGDDLTIWTVPSWLDNLRNASLQGKPTVLFLDELTRAPLNIRQSALQLVLEKAIHQHKLPDLFGVNTLIVASTNPANGYYSINSLDPALIDRFLVVDVECDTPSWLEWAQNNSVNKIVTEFISQNPSKLHYIPKENSDEISATPRSWTMLGKFIDEINSIPKNLHKDIIRGKIGNELALEFLEFLDKNIDTKIRKKVSKKENEILKDFF